MILLDENAIHVNFLRNKMLNLFCMNLIILINYRSITNLDNMLI